VTVTYIFGGIAVTDFTAASGWYERLFGRPPDMLPHDQEAIWRLTSGGAVYLVRDPERAGKCLVTLAVADLEAHVSRLRAEGLASPRKPKALRAAWRSGTTMGTRSPFSKIRSARQAETSLGQRSGMTPDAVAKKQRLSARGRWARATY